MDESPIQYVARKLTPMSLQVGVIQLRNTGCNYGVTLISLCSVPPASMPATTLS